MSGGPEILLHLDRGHPDTLGEQVRAGIRDAIRSGRLPAGTPLTPSRILAEDLGVSRGVVVDAYAQLVAEGFLVTRPGSATVVSDTVGVTPRWRHRSAPPEPQRIWRPDFDLRPAGPDLAMFPRSQAARTFADLLRHLPTAELGYTGPWGATRLREQLAAYLNRVRAAMAAPDGVVVTTGGTQALTIAARTLAALGHQAIGVEDPSDPPLRHLLRVHGLEPVPVPVDEEGLDVTALAATGCRAVLASPSYQYPTGVLMSAARRSALLEWAAARPGLIIEDDRRSAFHFGRHALACLQGMRPAEVIMLGSVSLAMAPAMRLGWLVPPPALLKAVADTKRDDDFGTGLLEQHALASWLESGLFDRHVRHLRRAYAVRKAELSGQLSRHFPGWTQHGAMAGLELLLELPSGLAEPHVVAHARQLGLGIGALGPMRIRSAGPAGLLLSYARLQPRHCQEAAVRLRHAVDAVLAEGPALTAAAIGAEGPARWRLVSSDWPAPAADFYAL
jgi:GntR family transcriptional regulator/MocR family aminotransferase